MPRYISAYELQQRDGLTRQQVLELAEVGPAFIYNDGYGRYNHEGPVDNREYIENEFQSLKQVVVSDWSNLSHRFENEPDERWNNYIYERFPEDISGKIANKLLGENCPEVIQINLNNDYSMRNIVSMMANKRMINLFYIPEPWRVNRETVWAYLSKQPSTAVDLYFERIFKADLFFDPENLPQLKGKKDSQAVAREPSAKESTKRAQDKKPTITSDGKPVNANKDEDHHRWLTTEEAAKYIGCSKNFLDKDRITRLHDIPFSKLGRHIRYDSFELDEYLEKTQVRTSKK